MKPINQQKILAVETCTTICSVALWDGEKMYGQVIETERSHSKQILPMCEAVLADAHLAMRDLDAIACTRGPGSFTGLRIGVGVAKGLAFGQDLPIYGVSSLDALAYRVTQADSVEHIWALLDARMGELYAAEYDVRDGFPHLLGKEMLVDIEQVAVGEQLFAGTGAHEYADVLRAKGAKLSAIQYPLASDVIAVIQQGNVVAVKAVELAPVYLRDKVTD